MVSVCGRCLWQAVFVGGRCSKRHSVNVSGGGRGKEWIELIKLMTNMTIVRIGS